MDTVTKLTNDLTRPTRKAGGINHLDGKNLPSKRAVTDITVDLLRLLFPGFFDEKPVHSSEIKSETAALLDSVLARSKTKSARAWNISRPRASPKRTSITRLTS